jgi:hypothetical protein
LQAERQSIISAPHQHNSRVEFLICCQHNNSARLHHGPTSSAVSHHWFQSPDLAH